MSEHRSETSAQEALDILDQAYAYYTPLPEDAKLETDFVEYFEYCEAA